jgi:hypothetical protein
MINLDITLIELKHYFVFVQTLGRQKTNISMHKNGIRL